MSDVTPIGNLHLLLLHLPIGFVVLAVLLELRLWRRPSEEGRRIQQGLLGWTALAALVTAATGLVLASTGGYPEELLMRHRWAGVLCAVAAGMAWLVHRKRDPAGEAGAPPAGLWKCRTALLVLVLATVTAGHLGALLTHGPGVVPFGSRLHPERPPEVDPEGEFALTVRPILERYCWECHGVERVRGRLRLDLPAAARRGGRSGVPALVPGEPVASEMIRRMRLPRGDEKAMPPEDGTAPDEAEIAVLEAWIQAGAAWR
ncbi:MAG: hypothetical protein EA425_00720 [Puniceicoccaceae bacterium]|nr:MAG: hypothetical protein EA425_00720 [Puniceicoccaceae bacterium]